MKENLIIKVVQTNLFWEDKEKNLDNIKTLLEQNRSKSDLILLPEMFSTGFSMNPEKLSEEMDGKTIKWMKDLAKQMSGVVAGTLMIHEEGKFFNRSVWFYPDGSGGFYDKKYLFRFGDEGVYFTGGNEKKTFNVKGWNILPLTCYDLRFPVWSMNSYNNDSYEYDLLYYLANWPSARVHHWRSLLVARAIENQAYVAGVNRTGMDGNGIDHSGHSLVCDYFGNIIADAKTDDSIVLTSVLDYKQQNKYRNHFFIAPDWEM